MAAAVEAVEPRLLFATFPVTTTADAGAGSLRQAILDANASAGADTVSFAIPGTGPFTIAAASALPVATGPTRIDGATQPGYAGTPLVEVTGKVGSASSFSDGLVLAGDGSVVVGLAVNGFYYDQIRATGANVAVTGSYVGLRPDGTDAGVTSLIGVHLVGKYGRVGGTAAGDGNVIGAVSGGVLVSANYAAVAGNLIGTAPDGQSARPVNTGVALADQSSFATIGGSLAAARNVIASGTYAGISFGTGSAVMVTIAGNYIGTDATGTRPLGNGVGIDLSSGSNATIGGMGSPSEGNVISGNLTDGVRVSQGSFAPPTVGVYANRIGVGADGLPLGNGRDGVRVDAFASPPANGPQVGGGQNPQPNEIAYNGGAGVRVVDRSARAVVVSRSLIHDNAGLPIDVGAAGPTPSDVPEVDGWTNAPVLSQTSKSGVQAVGVSFDGLPSTRYTIEFYASPTASGGGRSFAGNSAIFTDANGHGGTLVVDIAAYRATAYITAVVTGTAGGTGEFADPVAYDAAPPLSAVIQPLNHAIPTSPLSNATFTFSRSVAGLTLDDLVLTRDGGATNLLAGSSAARLIRSADGRTWSLTGLPTLTADWGTYTLAFVPGATVTDGLDSVEVPVSAPPQSAAVVPGAVSTILKAFGPNPRVGPFDAVTFTFDTPVAGLDLSDVRMSWSGSSAGDLLTAAQTVTTADGGLTWTLSNLSPLTAAAGDYTIQTTPSASVDVAGFDTFVRPASATVKVLAQVNYAVEPVAPSPRGTPVASLAVTFDRPVTGIDLSDLALTRDGGPNLLSAAANSVVSQDAYRFVVTNVAGLTTAAGQYTFGFAAGAQFSDVATGTTLPAAGATSFTVLPAAVGVGYGIPSAPTTVTPNPVTIFFANAVTGLTADDLRVLVTSPGGSPADYSLASLPATLDHSSGGNYWYISGLGAAFPAPCTVKIYASPGATVKVGAVETLFTVDLSYTLVRPLAGTIERPSPDPRTTPVDQLAITFSEPATGFDLSDVRLTRDGQPVPLASPAQTLTSDDGGRTWALAGLAGVTAAPGAYRVRVPAGGTFVVGPAGQFLVADVEQSWQTTAPAAVTTDRRPTADANVRNGSNAAKNFGAAAELQAGWSGLTDGGRQSDLRFDLAGLSSTAAGLKSAVLRLYGRTSDGKAMPVGVYVATDAWTESGVTWNSRPIPDAKLSASKSVAGTANAWYEFDVTAAVMAARAAGKSAITLCVKYTATSVTYATFASDETATPPVLRVTQTATVAQPKLVVTPTTLSVGEGKTNSFGVKLDAPVTGTVTVTVERTGGDADLYIVAAGGVGLSGVTLTFTKDNWNVAQTVTLGAYQDADATNGSASFLLTLPGAPTVTLTAAEADDDVPPPPATKTLRPTADNYVRDGAYAGTNYGSAADLQVRKSSTGGQSRWTVLKFDLTSLATISNATLRLYGKLDSTANPSVQLQAFAASNATWTEAGVTWANKPLTSGGVLGTVAVAGTAGKWYTLDLTAWLKAQKAAGKTSASLVLTSPVATTSAAVFTGDEAAANGPQLVVKA